MGALLALAPPVAMEAQRFRFTRLGLEDGLSQNSVYSLAQDSEGFLWVGTQNGLNRYDGGSFRFQWQTAGQPSPVGFGFIRTLFVDSQGRLWVGVDSHGAYLFERQTESFVSVPLVSPDGSEGIPDQVRDIAQLNGRVAVATSDGLGVSDFEGPTPVLRQYELTSVPSGCGTSISSLWAASSTELWIGTAAGCVLGLDLADGGRVGLVAELGGRIRDMSPATGEAVWITVDGRGVRRFERAGNLAADPNAVWGAIAQATSVLASRAGDTWIGTPAGLGWIPAEGRDPIWFSMGSEEHGDLPHDQITALFEDRQGVIWVGTWNGLARVSPFHKGIGYIPTPSTPDGPARGGVVAIEPARGERVVLGMIGGGLAEVSLDGTEVRELQHPEMTDVSSLTRNEVGDLWVATFGTGVYRRSADGWRSYRAGVSGAGGSFDDRVGAIKVDRHGVVWAGTVESGLGRYDPTADRFDPFPGPRDSGYAAPYIWPIVEDGEGALWFGANGPEGGIHRLSADRSRFTTYATGGPERPNGGRLLTLHLSGDTLVWFGTQGAGLGRLEPGSGEIAYYTEAAGLPHDNVQAILEDETGKLWITTNDGLARFDPATEQFWVFRRRSGIQANRFFANSALKLPDGTLLFGGTNGVSVVRPANIVPRDEPPPVALTAFRVRGQDRADINHVTAQRGVELAPNENFFTIEFAALDFTDASLNAFRYRLEGLDPDWIEGGAGENVASYTSVPPDRYVFRVQARNSEGVWNRVGLTIPIVVLPPYYATWWFRLAVIALIATALWGANTARLRQLAHVRALRLRITGDLHDDIGANLSAIALKSELLQKQETPQSKRQSSLADIERLARETSQKVREMIWVVKEEHDSTVGLLDQLRNATATLIGGVIEYTFRVEGSIAERPIAMELRQDVYLVFKEMLQNVLKHAQATRVHVEVAHSRATFVLTVVDDGVGFPESGATAGNGLDLMRRRAEKHGGLLEIDSSPGAGTRLTLTVETR